VIIEESTAHQTRRYTALEILVLKADSVVFDKM